MHDTYAMYITQLDRANRELQRRRAGVPMPRRPRRRSRRRDVT